MVAVNKNICRTIIIALFVPTSGGIDVDNVWFQQYGATCHASLATIDLLHEAFDND